jgi:hypothetical protein
MTWATILMPGSSPFQLSSNRCAAIGSSPRGYQRCRKGCDSCSVHFAHADQLCRKIIEGKLMPTWLRSLVNAFLGKVPGKTSRLDTATRMAMDADFSDRQESMPHGLRSRRERDDGHLVKPTGSSADLDPVEELIRVVSEAQGRDAEDELRLYHPMGGDRPSFFQRRRPNRR